VNDSTWAPCEEAVHEALAHNGAADPGEALCALLWLLRDLHRVDVAGFATRAYHEGFELPDPRATTVAESIRDLAAGTVGMHRPNADGERTRDDLTVLRNVEPTASGMQVVADILQKLIPLWDFEAGPCLPWHHGAISVSND